MVLGKADRGGKAAIDAVGSPIKKGLNFPVVNAPKIFHIPHGHTVANEDGGAIGQCLRQQPGDFAFQTLGLFRQGLFHGDFHGSIAR